MLLKSLLKALTSLLGRFILITILSIKFLNVPPKSPFRIFVPARGIMARKSLIFNSCMVKVEQCGFSSLHNLKWWLIIYNHAIGSYLRNKEKIDIF